MTTRISDQGPGMELPALAIPEAKLGVRTPADVTVVALAAVVGVAFDIAARSSEPGLGATVGVIVASAALITSRRLGSPAAIALAAAAPVFGLWFVLRASPWLLALDALAVLGLLASAAAIGTLDPWDLRLRAIGERAWLGALHVVAAPAFLIQVAMTRGANGPSERRIALPILRGLALAIPLVLVVGALLASADAVFASLVSPDLHAPAAFNHVAVIAVGAWGWGGLARIASAIEPPATPHSGAGLGAIEATAALALLGGVLAVFVGVQLVALAGGARHVLETSNLTYAEYARSGFFQLLAVGAIVLVAIAALRSATGGGDRRFVGAAIAVAVLTLAVVAVAVRRLALYDDAYGLTALRFLATVGAAWIGIVFALLIASLAGVGASRRWLPVAAAFSGVALLLVVNIADPDRLIARHDIDHAARTGRVDVGYLTQLSDDAVPALLSNAARLPAQDRDNLRAEVCGVANTRRGWPAWNVAAHRAGRARAEFCGRRVSL